MPTFFYKLSFALYSSTLLISVSWRSLTPIFHYEKKKFICSILTVQPAFFFRATSRLKNVTDIVWRFSTLLLWFFVGCFLCWLDRYMQTTVVRNDKSRLKSVYLEIGLKRLDKRDSFPEQYFFLFGKLIQKPNWRWSQFMLLLRN